MDKKIKNLISELVIVFDFDGVLAHPNGLFNNTLILEKLYQYNTIMCIASFNSHAIKILRAYKLDYLFKAWRCGISLNELDTSLNINEDPILSNTQKMTKVKQIKSIIYELTKKNIVPKNNGKIFEYNEKIFPLKMTRTEQPKEINNLTSPKIIFFDDDIDNIIETLLSNELTCWPVKIDSFYGIPNNLIEIIIKIALSWNFIITHNIKKWCEINKSLFITYKN